MNKTRTGFAVELALKRWTCDFVGKPAEYENLASTYIGSFETEAEAQKAYEAANAELNAATRYPRGCVGDLETGPGHATGSQVD